MTENMHTSARYEPACRRAALSSSRYLLIASTYTIVYAMSLLAIDSAAHAGPGQSERQTIVTLSQEGRSSIVAGRPEKALEAYQKALVQVESGEDYLTAAALHNLIGEMFEDLHEIQTALVYYEQGTEILRTKQVRNSSAYEPRPGLGNKGYTGSFGAPVSVDLYRGRVSELKALLDKPQAASHQELFVLLAMNAGNMYLYQNQYEQAERYYNQALATAREVRDQLREQEVLTNLAWSAIKQHKLRDAQRRLEGAFSPVPSIPGTTQLRRAVLALV